MKKRRILRNLKLGDIIVFLIILLAAVLSFFIMRGSAGRGGAVAVIIHNGTEIQRIDLNSLDDREEIRVGGEYNNVIIVEKGRIRFKEADCPEKVCVNTGWISRPGQVAACLPAGVVIKIVGESSDEVDIYLR